MKTRTRKLWKGSVSSDFLTKLPSLSTFVDCMSMEDDGAVVIVNGLQLGARS